MKGDRYDYKAWHEEVLCNDGIVLYLDSSGGYRNVHV